MQLFNKKELEYIGAKLLKKKETLAIAESVTAGLLQNAISNIPDASKFFQGGITAYNVAQKFKHLKVEPLHAIAVNCVSQQVANEMALQVCEMYGSHWGVAVTGYATPTPESGNKVFSFYAIVYRQKVMLAGRIPATQMDPPELQLRYVNYLVHKLYKNIS